MIVRRFSRDRKFATSTGAVVRWMPETEMNAEDLALDACDLDVEQAKKRFDWAVRQGHPNWLWPNVSFEEWSSAQKQMESVARQVLVRGRSECPMQGGETAIGIAGYTSGMGPLLGYWLRTGLISAPPAVAGVLDYHYRHNTLRMERMARRALAVVNQLADRGVDVTVLKGMDTAFACFPEAGCRPLSDIDLLIDRADEGRAAEVLLGMNFRPGRVTKYPPEQNWRMAGSPTLPRSLAFVHADDPWSVDLQTSLNRRYSYGAPVLDLDRVRTPAELAAWGLSPRASKLAPAGLVVHLACHASCGHESLTLLRLVELVMIVRKSQETSRFAWDDVIALADRARALTMTYPALRLAEQLAPGTVPEHVLALCERRAPLPVRRVVERLKPHDAQKVFRCSLEERFMWTRSPLHRLVQVVREIWPPATPFSALIWIWRMRAWRLVRGTLTR